jgi:hypothetical protein
VCDGSILKARRTTNVRLMYGAPLAAGQGAATNNPATPKYQRGKVFQNGPGATRTCDLLLRMQPADVWHGLDRLATLCGTMT